MLIGNPGKGPRRTGKLERECCQGTTGTWEGEKDERNTEEAHMGRRETEEKGEGWEKRRRRRERSRKSQSSSQRPVRGGRQYSPLRLCT